MRIVGIPTAIREFQLSMVPVFVPSVLAKENIPYIYCMKRNEIQSYRIRASDNVATKNDCFHRISSVLDLFQISDYLNMLILSTVHEATLL